MRTGPLSDEAVMRMCAQFRPVPLDATNLVDADKPKADHQHSFRAPKYSQPPPRPINYNAMSNSMARQMDPTNEAAFTDRLNKQYMEALPTIHSFPLVPAIPGGDNNAMVMRINRVREIALDQGFRFTANILEGGVRLVIANTPAAAYALYRAGFRIAQFSYENAPFTTYDLAVATAHGVRQYVGLITALAGEVIYILADMAGLIHQAGDGDNVIINRPLPLPQPPNPEPPFDQVEPPAEPEEPRIEEVEQEEAPEEPEELEEPEEPQQGEEEEEQEEEEEGSGGGFEIMRAVGQQVSEAIAGLRGRNPERSTRNQNPNYRE